MLLMFLPRALGPLLPFRPHGAFLPVALLLLHLVTDTRQLAQGVSHRRIRTLPSTLWEDISTLRSSNVLKLTTNENTVVFHRLYRY